MIAFRVVRLILLFAALGYIANWAWINLSVHVNHQPLAGDSMQYGALAQNIARGDGFSLSGEPHFRREPGYPAFVSLVHGQKLAGVSSDCLQKEAECNQIRREINIANVWVWSTLVFATGFAAFLVSGSVIAGGVAAAILAGGRWFYVAYPSPEPMSALLVVLHSTGLYCLFASRQPAVRILGGLVAGASLGALILFKAVFVYWLYLLVVAGILVAWRSTSFRAGALIAVLLPTLIAGSWMTRNAYHFGDFAISGRDGEILAIRAAHLDMTWPEFWAGFYYFAPSRPEFVRKIIPEPSAENMARFDRTNPDGFYVIGKTSTRGEFDHRDSELRSSVGARILSQPFWHLTQSTLFAWQASFPPLSRFERHWLHPTSYAVATWTLLFGTASLLAVFSWALLRRNLAVLAFVLPALFCWGIHSVATHAIPRYSTPIVPIMVIGVVAVAAFTVSVMATTIRRLLENQKEATA